MYATLLCAALAFPQDPPRPAGGPDRPAVGAAASVDGTWTVVAVEKNGQPVADARNMTVTIKGSVVTFNAPASSAPGAGADRNQLRAMRLDFGPNGTIRVTEADASGKFGDPGPARPGTGTAPPDRPATPPPAGTGARPDDKPGTRPADRPGAGAMTGSKTGVYILTQEYLAICIHEESARPGSAPGGDRPGSALPGTGTAPGGDRPGTGAAPPPGGDRPGAGPDRPGAGFAGAGPQQKSYVTVLLKRSGGPDRPGAPDRPNPNPNPDR